MFVLNELDKILKNLAPPTRDERKVEQFKVSLPNIEQLEVEQMQLALKVRYPSLSSSTIEAITAKTAINLNELFDNKDEKPSMNKVFFELVYKLVLTKLIAMPERHYASARLIICDWTCYELMMKFRRLSSSISFGLRAKSNDRLLGLVSGKNLIYKKTFGATAIFLLSDIVDVFNRQNDPLIIHRLDRSTGKTIMAYNTSIIKQTFPYLRMSDLLILLQDKKQLQLGSFNVQSSREHQVLQFLNHFARSTELIELNFGNYRILNKLHTVYNNVLVVANNDADFGQVPAPFSKLQLPQISLMVQQLLQMVDLLKLNIISVTYRQADVSGQTKVFSQLLASSLKVKQQTSQPTDSQRKVKVLVVDRFYDLASVLYHADKYGAYLEQEKQFGNIRSNKFYVENLDELDEQLQFVQLTDVLSGILKFTMSLKSVEVEKNRFKDNRKFPDLASSVFTSSQSIKRNLELVKSMYKSLNEGYLLMLRLEMSLETIDQQLRSPDLDEKQAEELTQRLERMMSIFKQFINIPTNAIKVPDLVRFACLLLDLGNRFSFVIKQRNFTNMSFKEGTIQETLEGKDFERAIDAKQQDFGGNEEEEKEEKILENYRDVKRKLARFDKLSKEFCAQKSALSVKEMVENFDQNQLDAECYPTVNVLEHRPSQSTHNPIILAFLGSITAHELSKIKSLNASKRLYLIAYNLSKPDAFLKAL